MANSLAFQHNLHCLVAQLLSRSRKTSANKTFIVQPESAVIVAGGQLNAMFMKDLFVSLHLQSLVVNDDAVEIEEDRPDHCSWSAGRPMGSISPFAAML